MTVEEEIERRLEWQHPEISREEARDLLTEREQAMHKKVEALRKSHTDSIQAEETFDDRYRYNQPTFHEGVIATECKCLRNITEAWERLKDNTWGICTECGEEIPRGRLESIPEAEHCTPCSKEHSTQDQKQRRGIRSPFSSVSPSFA